MQDSSGLNREKISTGKDRVMGPGKGLKPAIILGGLAAFGVIVYLLASASVFKVGFPLDDAWIHQTYARNLGKLGEWSFVPGVTSAGSTSPLWTVILSIGYILGLSPYVWTYLCGFLSLWGLAWVGEAVFRKNSEKRFNFPWIGAFVALEWHLVWAAASGMETVLFSALILAVFWLLSLDSPRWLIAGVLASLAVWVRPDGVTIMGPVMFLAFLQGKDPGNLRRLFYPILGFATGFIPYILFNLAISGRLWPNTLFAKQAEYAAQLQIPLLERAGSILSLPLVGAGILLLPGFIFAIWRGIHEKRWLILAIALWWIGYNMIYLVSLPLTYQHGRYLIPSMPSYFLLGGIGLGWLWRSWLSKKAWRKMLRTAWASGVLLLNLSFLGVGAWTYAQDVAIIETEMVATANWLSANISAGTKIAVHDIGAIGYFSDVDIVDTAGLISPEVIPIIRDENKLAKFLDAHAVEYLVTFPAWYPDLVKRGTMIFQTSGVFSPAAGGENMAVYRWNPR